MDLFAFIVVSSRRGWLNSTINASAFFSLFRWHSRSIVCFPFFPIFIGVFAVFSHSFSALWKQPQYSFCVETLSPVFALRFIRFFSLCIRMQSRDLQMNPERQQTTCKCVLLCSIIYICTHTLCSMEKKTMYGWLHRHSNCIERNFNGIQHTVCLSFTRLFDLS